MSLLTVSKMDDGQDEEVRWFGIRLILVGGRQVLASSWAIADSLTAPWVHDHWLEEGCFEFLSNCRQHGIVNINELYLCNLLINLISWFGLFRLKSRCMYVIFNSLYM